MPDKLKTVAEVVRTIPDGSHIPIEERPADEVLGYRKVRWAPKGVQVRNPAFDVTPAELITGIICEKGVLLHPTAEKIRALVAGVAQAGTVTGV